MRDEIFKIVKQIADKHLRPVREVIEESEKIAKRTARVSHAKKLYNKMVREVRDVAFLDFSTDIAPELHRFIDKHLKATQEDVYEYFKNILYKKTIAKIKKIKIR